MFNTDNFVSARFTNNARNLVEVLYTHDDEIHPFMLDINDKDNPDIIRLFEIYSMDELHESTYQFVQDQQKGFEQAVMSIAERDGLVSKLAGDDWETILNMLFTDIENEDHLFALKLALFEMDVIKKSKAKKKKTDLRKAKTKIEVLKVAFQFIK
tara:strand:- start:841 stop:1305 length:465 start_codon:yes stop_codon:yes gene_type:complete